MSDAWWYVENFLLGAVPTTVVIIVVMKVFVFLCQKFSDNPKYKD
ncbi:MULTISPECIES: hypothetical protein [Metabacillus]|nr:MULTISPECIES: hypothetical protein [Metabacillus]